MKRFQSSRALYVMKMLNSKPGMYAAQLVTESNREIKDGTVYVILRRLLTDGLVVCDPDESKHKGVRRPRYKLTASGAKTLKEWAR